jgi:hypothetical protein
MSPQDWAAFALSITSLVGAFAVMIRWMVKHYLAELKPNGGSSMRDAVNVNTERLNRVESRVDDIYKLLCEKP